MTRTRAFAGVFLRCGDEVLLMQRGLHKRIAPGLWAGIAGHIEPGEAGDPEAAVLREIYEETGIPAAKVEDLSLRYVALIRGEDTLDTVNYFIGRLAEKPDLATTDEGAPHWVRLADAPSLPMTVHVAAFLTHWLDNPSFDGLHCVLVGADGSCSTNDL